jgi:hypothetical protein
MQDQTLNAMILNTGLEMELDPDNKEKRYNELIRDTRNILGCNEIEAIKIILQTLINQGK